MNRLSLALFEPRLEPSFYTKDRCFTIALELLVAPAPVAPEETEAISLASLCFWTCDW